MNGIDERKNQGNRDRLNTLASQALDGTASSRFIEWSVNRSVRTDSLGNSQAPSARNNRGGRLETNIPDVFLVAPAKFKFVAKTLGGQKSRHGTLHLNQCIVRHRRAVNDGVGGRQKFLQRKAARPREFLQSRHHGEGVVLGRAGYLLKQDLIALLKREISKRPPYVYANPAAQSLGPRLARNCSVASRSTSRSKASTVPRNTTP